MTAHRKSILAYALVSSRLILLLLTSSLSSVLADSRDDFVEHILPVKYPQLIGYLQAKARLPVSWASQTGEQQSLIVELTPSGAITITTAVNTGLAQNLNVPTLAIMVDTDLDSRLDYVDWLMEGVEPQRIDNPRDDASLILWDTSLAIIMNFSDCCPR